MLLRVFIGLVAGMALAAGCSVKPRDDQHSAAPEASELALLLETLVTVHERYVDPEAATVDRLIENSLHGMIAALDPHARLERNPEQVPSPVPGIPPIEISPSTDQSLLVIRVFGFIPSALRTIRSLESAYRNSKPEGILLDIRGATGTDYTVAAALAEWFLPPDSVVGALQEKAVTPPRVWTTRRLPLWPEAKLVVLVDGFTEGPAELLAAALRFHRRGLLAGEATRGLAIVQATTALSAEWNLSLTTGRILDPDGNVLTDAPLIPDIVIAPRPGEVENVDWIYHQGLQALNEWRAP